MLASNYCHIRGRDCGTVASHAVACRPAREFDSWGANSGLPHPSGTVHVNSGSHEQCSAPASGPFPPWFDQRYCGAPTTAGVSR